MDWRFSEVVWSIGSSLPVREVEFRVIRPTCAVAMLVRVQRRYTRLPALIPPLPLRCPSLQPVALLAAWLAPAPWVLALTLNLALSAV
jgi:hypothetical protein